MVASASPTSAPKSSTRKMKSTKKAAASKSSVAKPSTSLDDSSKRVVFALFVLLYICGALAFCVQIFVSPDKLSGLATVQQNNKKVVSTPTPPVTSTTNTNRFHINPNTIQGLQGLSDQEIRKKLGSEVQVQLLDKNGVTLHTTAKVDVQTTTQPRNNNDVTVNYDIIDGIAVYHCQTSSVHTKTTGDGGDVLLLNAGRYLAPDFFNETLRQKIPKGKYHEKVFLDLCNNGKGIVTSITALDVVNIQPERLLYILQLLKFRGRIRRMPVAALISPGESSDTIVDWISYGPKVSHLRESVAERWIPVASESVLELDPDDSLEDEITENASATLRNSALDELQGWPVLAVYGSRDFLARQGAELLEREINAKTIKMEGGSDFHEQDPNEFAKAVMKYLSDELKDKSQTATTTASATTQGGLHFSFQVEQS